jgi:hypothetical protein
MCQFWRRAFIFILQLAVGFKFIETISLSVRTHKLSSFFFFIQSHLTFIFHLQQKEVKVHKFAPCNITEIPVVQFNTSTLVVTGGKNILTFVGYWNITEDLTSPLNVIINQ